MSTLFLNNTECKLKIDTIRFDCSKIESHNYTSTLTQYPVEDGTYIHDNVWILPFQLEIVGIVSGVSFFEPNAAGSLQSRITEAYDTLMQLREKRIVFEVLTGLKIYQNMIFIDLELRRNSETGFSIDIKASLKQLKIIDTKNKYNKNSTSKKSFYNKVNYGTQQIQEKDIDSLSTDNMVDVCEVFGACSI